MRRPRTAAGGSEVRWRVGHLSLSEGPRTAAGRTPYSTGRQSGGAVDSPPPGLAHRTRSGLRSDTAEQIVRRRCRQPRSILRKQCEYLFHQDRAGFFISKMLKKGQEQEFIAVELGHGLAGVALIVRPAADGQLLTEPVLRDVT